MLNMSNTLFSAQGWMNNGLLDLKTGLLHSWYVHYTIHIQSNWLYYKYYIHTTSWHILRWHGVVPMNRGRILRLVTQMLKIGVMKHWRQLRRQLNNTGMIAKTWSRVTTTNNAHTATTTTAHAHLNLSMTITIVNSLKRQQCKSAAADGKKSCIVISLICHVMFQRTLISLGGGWYVFFLSFSALTNLLLGS